MHGFDQTATEAAQFVYSPTTRVHLYNRVVLNMIPSQRESSRFDRQSCISSCSAEHHCVIERGVDGLAVKSANTVLSWHPHQYCRIVTHGSRNCIKDSWKMLSNVNLLTICLLSSRRRVFTVTHTCGCAPAWSDGHEAEMLEGQTVCLQFRRVQNRLVRIHHACSHN